MASEGSAPTQRLVITVEEACELLGISRTLAYQSLREDNHLLGITPLRIGRRILIPRQQLLDVVGNHVAS